ncbi:M3 family oligoendopeptidase [Paenibacillus protaetiae]|uniref:M3 family oligoendopeptidase n=1 Tax=Paenibacillus protaetiae TaxID=2509456 RepID=A0A4P6EW30_9BACL|nr:M3 family oligoendopeptidase [Paenibacillus protaetiae]QAY66785.1 M3 family oligoendopeptidase [Paenibacillus protaetiae]
MSTYPLTWNLDVIYEGGSSSPAFAAELQGIEQDVVKLDQLVAAGEGGQPEQLTAIAELMQSILLRIRESDSFVSCLLAQNMKDAKAAALSDRVKTASAKFDGVLTRFDSILRSMDDSAFEAWLSSGAAAQVAFNLRERRELAKEKLAPEQEALIGDLAVNGYHGWGEMYNTIVSRAKFTDKGTDGTEKTLSAGQMFNRLSDGDRAVRETAFAEWERVWGEQADLCSDTLNRLAGFRLGVYENRGWEEILKEPLHINRMSEATLNAMWDAITEGKPEVVRYLERKAKLLGVEKLEWHDVTAPLGADARTIPYEEACEFIVEQFRSFSPDMADFADMALKEGWIEAEDRPGKRPGGFCTSLPLSGQTRIFMTYSGTMDNVSTLAHELGHGYHQHVMNDMPALSQEYAMNVAETASTLAELIVTDSAMKAAKSDEEKLGLLETKLQNAVAFFLNIHARFIFEKAFYAKRKQGMVTAEELNELMEEAQREAYAGSLGSTHPHFWASKLHFYLTDVPFYNFPYTFGYLFSTGIYARAQQEGPSFAEKYVALLRDTGSMTVEELAKKHLGVNLEEPDFWREAVQLAVSDVKLFLELTEQ